MEQTYDDSLTNYEPNMEETYENPLTYHKPNQEEEEEEEEEEEDTLSLSDLPIYRDAADEDDLPTGELPSPRTLSEHDLFEFSSGQILATSLPTIDPPPQDPIIFCGKIIPYKKEEEEEEPTHVSEDTGNVKKQRLRRRRWRIFRWKPAVYLFIKSSSSSSSSTNSSSKGSMNSGKSGSTKLGLKDDGNKRRVSILATGAGTESRWYMIMFGFGSARFNQSSEMKIRDLRKRQSFFMGSRSGGSGGSDDDDRKSSRGSCGCGRGMGLIRFLGCGGDEVDHHANAIVKV